MYCNYLYYYVDSVEHPAKYLKERLKSCFLEETIALKVAIRQILSHQQLGKFQEVKGL